MFNIRLDSLPAGKFNGKDLFFHPVRVFLQEFLPARLALGGGERIHVLVVVAEGDGEGVRGIEMPGFQRDAEGLFQHHLHLLLRGGAVADNRLLGLAGGIFRHGSDTPLEGRDDRRTLGAAEFQDDLRILPVERGFDGQFIGMIGLADLADAFMDRAELGIGVLLLPQVQDAHVHVRGLLPHGTDDPETQQLGSGVDAEDGLLRAHPP